MVYNLSLQNKRVVKSMNEKAIMCYNKEYTSYQICEVCSNTIRFCSCTKCGKCQSSLQVPYIECTQCLNKYLCCKCFSVGSEFSSHKSDHNYRVVKHDFILFENSNWTASEELVMLEFLNNYGYGTWELVAEKLGNRTANEVRDHYNEFYINKPMFDQLPRVPETEQSLFPNIVTPYKFKLVDVDEPPRYAQNTVGFESVAGYNAARSDFEVEYDANAEQLLANLNDVELEPSDPSYQIITDLQYAVIRSYNRRLRERQKRKFVVREHGMILMRKNMSWMHRYGSTLTRRGTERLMAFMRYFTGIGFDLFMESLHRAEELRQRIARLLEYRRKGINTLKAAEVYEKVNRQKEQNKKDFLSYVSNPIFNWKCLEKNQKILMQPNKRSQFRPLDIIGLPGYEKLSKKEQDLCTNVRLVPQSYLELKELLIAENKKLGFLKLQTARKMLKIDVNKTRKLYDFLLQEGFVSKPCE